MTDDPHDWTAYKDPERFTAFDGFYMRLIIVIAFSALFISMIFQGASWWKIVLGMSIGALGYFIASRR